jgi:hypothetical protein
MRNKLTRLGRILLFLVATLALMACMGPAKQQRVKTSTIKNPGQEHIVGLTTVKGVEIQFDQAGVYAQGSVRGKVKGADFQIPIEQVERLWVMRRSVSKGRTVALVAGVAVAATVIAVKERGSSHPSSNPTPAPTGTGTAGGCPFVYAWDGEEFTFDAELYGGAVSKGLERMDYSELPHLRAERGSYRILLADELEETDFTDSLELWVVDHPGNTRVGVDHDGRLYSLGDAQPPLEARDEAGADLLPWLEATDRRILEAPPAELPNGRLRHEIVLSFAKPPAAQTAKLYVHAGTGEWGIRMLSALYELYGRDIDARMTALDGSPAEVQSIRDWGTREDLYALKVWVEEPSGWQVRGVIPGGGMGARVVSLDVSHVPGARLRIRVQPPAGFWAINSVAVDYSADQPLQVTHVAPSDARSESGRNVNRELLRADGVYYRAVRGESAEVVFPATPTRAGTSRTIFLASKGYYRPSIRSMGTPDAAALSQIFTVPDGMARFTAQRYAAWLAAAGTRN